VEGEWPHDPSVPYVITMRLSDYDSQQAPQQYTLVIAP
jgi:hypothetical protein